jgi:hypothetical protein
LIVEDRHMNHRCRVFGVKVTGFGGGRHKFAGLVVPSWTMKKVLLYANPTAFELTPRK